MSNRRRDEERRRRERLRAEATDEAHARRRRLLIGGGTLAGLAAILVALIVLPGGGGGTPKAAPAPGLSTKQRRALPKPIANGLAHANQVLDVSLSDELALLRGVPVVVNQWASWCPNCRLEFPFFQHEAKRFESKVAFLGLDSQDDQGNAEAFLKQYPVTYPSVFDPTASQAASIGAGRSWPTTVFFDSRGRAVNIHIGAYASERLLRADIERYAVGRG